MGNAKSIQCINSFPQIDACWHICSDDIVAKGEIHLMLTIILHYNRIRFKCYAFPYNTKSVAYEKELSATDAWKCIMNYM